MTDPATNRISRSVAGVRPVHSPMGPRTRFQRVASSPEMASSPRDSLSTTTSSVLSPLFPLSPARSEAPLPSISEREPPPVSPPTPDFPPIAPPVFKPIPKQPKLTPAPVLNFESVPVEWKGLPLEAALWTFDSQELQQLVSRAIRSSASESFIRLLSIENLDRVLPTEIEQLTKLKAITQAKYRFLVHRRTMLLQALNSSSGAPDRIADDGVSVIGRLTLQLSQTTADCDELLQELLRITDQLAQISKMIDLHWASALAVALRKLNKSYGRRTSELSVAREKIKQLEAELEDAWREAEQAAREIDELAHGAPSDDDCDEGEVAVIERAELVTIPSSPLSPKPGLFPLGGTLMQVEPLPVMSPLSPMPRISAISPALIDDKPPMTPPSQDVAETSSIRSVRSVKSTKSARSIKSTRSMRTIDGTRLSQVSAAKTRSHRASKGSLRLPKSVQIPQEEHPPVPDIPLEFVSTPLPPTSPTASSKFFHDSRTTSPTRPPTSSARPRKTSLDDIMHPRCSISTYAATVTMDDIYVRPYRPPHRSDVDIEIVPRTPPPRPLAQQAEYRPPEPPSERIPSMWLHADAAPPAQKTPLERFESSGSKRQRSYNKLKTLTKRYSMPFPLFRSTSSSSKTRPASRQSS
ncbi:hypothetical protein BDZ94DRAFT_1288521 [Collybia nuda]|uniref:Uncharacterized protein n=1 Tax=Collybia nuda TaxID=64659 RepID=A0A9P5YA62_9AGAR|nr:hypothetical protein BDZ94DRAFT_1288521 [Collybia nuda]